MANASVELSWVTPVGAIACEIFAHCVRQETLAISGTTATLATAVQASEADNGLILARVATDDTGCYVARGKTPDPTATAQSLAADGSVTTSARRWIPAGGELVMRLQVGDKVAVHS